ncbi:hypothetical protein D3C86_2032210 [compost metagenome]
MIGLEVEHLRVQIARLLAPQRTRINVPRRFDITSSGMLNRLGVDANHDLGPRPASLQLPNQK